MRKTMRSSSETRSIHINGIQDPTSINTEIGTQNLKFNQSLGQAWPADDDLKSSNAYTLESMKSYVETEMYLEPKK